MSRGENTSGNCTNTLICIGEGPFPRNGGSHWIKALKDALVEISSPGVWSRILRNETPKEPILGNEEFSPPQAYLFSKNSSKSDLTRFIFSEKIPEDCTKIQDFLACGALFGNQP